jgi:uncharacterized membrane protein YraQ (UPF0718 family)
MGAHFGKGGVLDGLWGMFLSPGKSIFLYAPPLVLALAGYKALVQRHRATAIALAVTAVPPILLSARSTFWAGDWAWGPRYLVFALPALVFPVCLVLERLLERRRRAAFYGAAGLALALGVSVQALGLHFYWDHFIRIAQEARLTWLGNPDRAGASMPDRGGTCDGCFEDMYTIQWLPPFQPIRGHLWLLRHVPFKHDWERAERDAPWHPSTSLKLPIAGSYSRARIDFWWNDYKEHKRAALRIFGSLTFLLIAGAAFFVWGARARPDHPAAARTGGGGA